MSFDLYNVNTGGADGCDERILGPRGPNQKELFKDETVIHIAVRCYEALQDLNSFFEDGYDDLESIAIEIVVEESHELEFIYRDLGVQVDYDDCGTLCEYCDVNYYKNNWENYMIVAAQRLIELYDELDDIEPAKPFEKKWLEQFHTSYINREVTV